MSFVKTAMIFGAAMATTLTLSAPASATVVYDAVKDFHGGVSTGVWSYGTGVAGVSFAPMSTFSATCEGAVGISCWQTPTPVDRVPLVAKNISGSTQYVYNTVVHPTNVLNVHPGPASDAIVRFTAPTTGIYSLTAFFQTLDINPNGVVVALYLNDVVVDGALFFGGGAIAPGTAGGGVGFHRPALSFTAGDRFDFTVNKGSSYYNDSTGLSATLSTAGVPEPATWALMIGGFGLAGAALRRRRAVTATA